MPFTDDDYLPCPAELDVPQELNVSSAVMRAAAHQMGKYCDNVSKEFMLCRREEMDPRKCLAENKAVTACGVDFLMKMKEHCYKEFTDYWQCLDYYGEGRYNYRFCRKSQVPYDECVLESLGQERVHFGYFGKIRLHDTDRCKPVQPPIRHAPLPDEIPAEFPCEDVAALRGHLAGELFEVKLKPILEDITKDMPKEEREKWYNFDRPSLKAPWPKYIKGALYEQEKLDKVRHFTSDMGW